MTQATETTDVLPEFFLVVSPGFEDLAANELLTWLPNLHIEVEHGGITFHSEVAPALELNRVLKVPTRLLLRLASFGCRDFPKLFKKAQNTVWEDWIPQNANVDFEVSSQASRLFVKKRIEETMNDGFKKRRKNLNLENKLSKDSAHETSTVFVRVKDDVVTFSIDTSGEILHKRGTRALTAEAPIRETIAASLLRWMLERDGRLPDESGEVRNEANTPLSLVDPMMGSGTFFLEAAKLFEAGTDRPYAFEKFPRYITARDAITGKLEPAFSISNPFQKFVGLDLDRKAIATTSGNLKPLIGSHEIQAIEGDIFKAKPLENSATPRWLIANPPYGERLKIEGPLKDYYETLFEACESFARPERACFVLPENSRPSKLRAPRGWKQDSILKFQNGGIPVSAVQFVRA